MADFFKEEFVADTNLPSGLPDPTTSSLSPTLYNSDPELEQVSLEPQPPTPQSVHYLSTSYIREKLAQARQKEASSSLETAFIYRVPKFLRDVDETAFTPQIVSLGPYHCGLQHLKEMDGHKVRALNRVLTRTEQAVDLYFDAVRSLEDRVRACYEAPLSISSDNLVGSLVLDSIFVIELFRGVAKGFSSLGYAPNDPVFNYCSGYTPNDPVVFKTCSAMHSLGCDIFKVENQLPLFLLDDIYALQLGRKPSREEDVNHLALSFCRFIRLFDLKSLTTLFYSHPCRDNDRTGVLHCLDLVHPKLTSRQLFTPDSLVNVCCAAELRLAGIKFRLPRGAPFWDIRFEDGILHIPLLLINEGTKSIFLNLMAFEQCHLKGSNLVTSYVFFMKSLIKKEEDVGCLKRIITNWLGNDMEVVNLFNQLGQAVRLRENAYCFSSLSNKVNLHCRRHRRWNASKAIFIHKYLSNPWTCISLVGAVVLLLLTFAQTFYTIYPYYNPIN